MQALYFGYFLHDPRDKRDYLFDLGSYFSGFVKFRNKKFKEALQHNGDTLLLLPFAPSVYMFVQARDKEVIKKISRSQWKADDIKQILGGDESVGFGSYVMIKDHWFAFCSKVLSPRSNSFAHFTNMLLAADNIPYQFKMTPFVSQISKPEVQKLDRVSKIALTMPKGSSLLNDLTSQFGLQTSDFEDVQSLIVEIKAGRERRFNLQKLAKKMSASVDDKQLTEFELRARETAADAMADFYVVGKGALRDIMAPKKESDVPKTMTDLAAKNAKLQIRIKEHESNVNFKKVTSLPDLTPRW